MWEAISERRWAQAGRFGSRSGGRLPHFKMSKLQCPRTAKFFHEIERGRFVMIGQGQAYEGLMKTWQWLRNQGRRRENQN